MSSYEGFLEFVTTHSELLDSYHTKINDWQEYLIKSKEEFNDKFKKPVRKKFDSKDLEYLSVIGKGSFGKVMLAFHTETKEYFAVKILDKQSKRYNIKAVLNEKYISHAIRFPFIVEMITNFECKLAQYFVFQLIPGGDLGSLLGHFGLFEEKTSRFYAAQILLALEYLHNINLIYRDLKPENILMDITGYLKLSDFGLCKHLVKHRTYTLCGTPIYMAPEIILQKGYDKSVDYWAFGILIYELNSGITPFYTESNIFTFSKIANGEYEMEPYFSSDLQDLITNLLQKNCSRRFGSLKNGIDDIKNHLWFYDINWLATVNRQYAAPYYPKHPDIEARFKKVTS